jgi:hypothetical protein
MAGLCARPAHRRKARGFLDPQMTQMNADEEEKKNEQACPVYSVWNLRSSAQSADFVLFAPRRRAPL